MYFHDRAEAGRLLAEQLMAYRYENTAVLALSPGGVLVGEEIARELHCGLSLLLSQRITAPGESSLVLGTIDQGGNFSYNNQVSPGQMEEYLEDFHGYLEEEKLRQMFDMTSIVGQGGLTRPELLIGRNVIVATDGVQTGLSFEAAFAYLKHLEIEKVIAAVPVGPADAISQITSHCAEMHYLYIPDAFISVGHYYEEKAQLTTEQVLEHINGAVAGWR